MSKLKKYSPKPPRLSVFQELQKTVTVPFSPRKKTYKTNPNGAIVINLGIEYIIGVGWELEPKYFTIFGDLSFLVLKNGTKISVNFNMSNYEIIKEISKHVQEGERVDIFYTDGDSQYFYQDSGFIVIDRFKLPRVDKNY